MKTSRLGFLILSGLILSCASSYTPPANTRDALIAYVDRAASLVRNQGLDACADFSTPRWKSGDYYIFISRESDDVVVCHPISATLVGNRQTDLQDSNGKYFVREMSSVGKSPAGRGWVEYFWPRPGQTTPEPKSAYVVAVNAPDGTRYLVGSGAYNLAPAN